MFERLACRTGSLSAGFLGVSFLVGSAIALPSAAHAQAGAVYGGAGGRYFEYSCGPGRVLVGLRGSAGVLLDSIQAICAGVDARSVTINSGLQGPVIGNDRPFDRWIECPVGYAVTAASMARNESYPHLGAIRLLCTELAQRADGGTRAIEMRGGGNLEGYRSPFGLISASEGGLAGDSRCPGGYAVGIRGRDDGYVTAFGLLCGPKPGPVAAPNAGRTLGKRKKQPAPLIGQRTPGDSTISSVPGMTDQPLIGQRTPGDSTISSVPGLTDQPRATLGKRKKRPPASSDPGPAQTDGPIGASVFTDSALPPPAAERETAPPSPLINGTYSTTLTIAESRCWREDLRGSWQRLVELEPQPGILIPLNEYNSIFAAPVMLMVDGLRLSQSTNIAVKVGIVTNVPANFEGAFTADGSRFDVRFQASNALCSVTGTISGVRT